MSRMDTIIQAIARVNDNQGEDVLRPLGESLITDEKFDEMLGLHHRFVSRTFIEMATAGGNPEETFTPAFSFVAAANPEGKHASQIWSYPAIDVSKPYQGTRKAIKAFSAHSEAAGALIGAIVGFPLAGLPGAIVGAVAGPISTQAIKNVINKTGRSINHKEQTALEERIRLLAKGKTLYECGYELIAVFVTGRVGYDAGAGRHALVSAGRTFDDRTNLGQSVIMPRTIFKAASLNEPEYRHARQDPNRSSGYEFYRNFEALYRMLDCVFMGLFFGFTLNDEECVNSYLKLLRDMRVVPNWTLSALRKAMSKFE